MALENISGKSLMRNTWLEVNLDNIAYNLERARDLVGKEVKIAAVLKANAYGHGALHVAGVLIKNKVDMLAVACLTEAIEIRRAYPDVPILVMGYTADDKLKIGVEHNIRFTIYSLEQAEILSEIGGLLNKEVTIHIKINTGMNRIGLKANNKSLDIMTKICGLENIKVEGIFSHFALKNHESDKDQYDSFINFIDGLGKRGVDIPIKHICDGISMVQYPQYHMDMVRIGTYIYGGQPLPENEEPLKLAMTLKSQIIQINEIEKGEGVGYDYIFVAKDKTIVGTLPIGYSDGYMRCLTGKGEVLVKGKRAPLIGKICMDQLMIDLTNIPDVSLGDEVILLGETPNGSIPLQEIADKVGTNRNEILSTVSRRVPRVYIEDSKIVDIVDYLLD